MSAHSGHPFVQCLQDYAVLRKMSTPDFIRSGKKVTTDEAVQFFGGLKKLADALGVWPQVIYKWGERPPMARQYEIQVKTEGKLRADEQT